MTLHSSRPDARTDLLHGTLDMLILRTLQWGPQHGYAIGQTIRAQSSDVLQVEAGSLYPALQRLAKKGWVTAKWGQTDANQRAKFYRLTPEGKKQLLREESRWTELVNAIGRVMNPAPAPEPRSSACRSWPGSRAEAAAPRRRGLPGGDPRAPGDRRGRADRRRRRSARARSYAVAEGLRQRHADHRSGPPRLDAVVARGPARSAERRPLRDPRAREEPGLLAHRGRRAHARHRPERRRLHDAQEHGAQPARRRRRLGAARASSSAKRAPGRDVARVVSRLPVPSRSRSRVLGALRLARRLGQPRQRPRRAPDLGRARHRQLLPGARRSRRSAAARFCRRTRSRPAAIRSS